MENISFYAQVSRAQVSLRASIMRENVVRGSVGEFFYITINKQCI
jgi:hypothetical protein